MKRLIYNIQILVLAVDDPDIKCNLFVTYTSSFIPFFSQCSTVVLTPTSQSYGDCKIYGGQNTHTPEPIDNKIGMGEVLYFEPPSIGWVDKISD